MTHEGYLRHLLVRKAVKTGQILVDIVTTTQLDFDMSEITEKLRNLQLDGLLVGFLHTYNDSIADVVKMSVQRYFSDRIIFRKSC